MEEKDYWFESPPLGRVSPRDWRGILVFLGLIAVLICATGVESALRPQHFILFALSMAVLAIIALGLAVLIVIKTKPRDETPKRP